MKKNLFIGFKAFSLIELLISLIIISIVLASFTPVLTKHFKNGAIALGTEKITSDCANTFSSDCKLCQGKKACLVCQKTTCPVGKFLDLAKCQCAACISGGYCKSCDNALNCKTCPTNRVLENGKCTKTCAAGYFAPDNNDYTECKNCNTIHPNCIRCTATSCKECKGNYMVENKTCVPTTATCIINYKGTEYTIKNAVKYTTKGSEKTYCMTSTNIGDGKYSDIPNAAGISPITSPNGVCSINSTWGAGANANTKCCWKHGNTAGSSNSIPNPDPGFDYAPQGRTLCNWWAAMVVCSKISSPISGLSWHLPSVAEFNSLKPVINDETTVTCSTSPKKGNIQKCAGKLGLQLCDRSAGYGSPYCSYSYDCKSSYGTNDCDMFAVWSNTESSTVTHAQHGYFKKGIFTADVQSNKFAGRSVRCILGPF